MTPPGPQRARTRLPSGALLLALLLAGCGGDAAGTGSAAPTGTPGATRPPTAAPATTGTATTGTATTGPATTGTAPAAGLLEGLTVRGRGPMTGYSREQYGPAWADVDRNGCDTRTDILRRDLTATRLKPGTGGCLVLDGVLAPDPYTGAELAFVRGGRSEIDIDHVVALGNAWVSGAARLPPDTRAALANDPLNLLAVDATANRQKGAGDAATWLPPHRPYRCAYVSRQVAVKAAYGLSVTPSERDAIARVLAGCGDQAAPTVATPTPTVEPSAPAPVPAPVPVPAPTSAGGAAASYASCREARDAGAAPLRTGDPGYRRGLDRDGDGVACE